jgi:hypothetical protein
MNNSGAACAYQDLLKLLHPAKFPLELEAFYCAPKSHASTKRRKRIGTASDHRRSASRHDVLEALSHRVKYRKSALDRRPDFWFA